MPIQNLGQVSAIYKGVSAPTNTNLLWRYTGATPNEWREYDTQTSSWVRLGSDIIQNYTYLTETAILQSGKEYAVDSEGGGFSLSLPTTSVSGDKIRIYSDFTNDSNAVTLTSSAIEGGTSYVLGSAANQGIFEIVYNTTDLEWKVRQLDGGTGSSGDVLSIEKNPFTETIEISNILQDSPKFTQTSALTIVKGVSSTFIMGAYAVTIATDGNAIDFSGDFYIVNNDYSTLVAGDYDFNFWLMRDGKIRVSVIKLSTDESAPLLLGAQVRKSAPSLLELEFNESIAISNITDLSLNFTVGTPKTISSINSVVNNILKLSLSALIENTDEFSFIAGSSNTIADLSSNTLAATSQNVDNNLILFQDRVNITYNASTDEYTAGSGGIDGNYMLCVAMLPRLTDGNVTIDLGTVTPVASDVLIAFRTSSVNQTFVTSKYYVNKKATGTYGYGENGETSQESGITITNNDLMRLNRTGSTVKAQYSSNAGSTWNDIHTFTGLYDEDIYCTVNLGLSKTIVSPILNGFE